MVLLLSLTPRAAADETSNVAGNDVTRTLKQNTPKWEEVLNPQLVRRNEQIKAEEERRAQEAAKAQAEQQRQAQASKPQVSSPAITGGKQEWLIASGIPENLWGYVDFIVSRESGWNPNAVNRSSGATGLCQSLPASKMASAGADYLTNPVTQLRWCNGYAVGRYGGWVNAVAFWQNNHWW